MQHHDRPHPSLPDTVPSIDEDLRTLARFIHEAPPPAADRITGMIRGVVVGDALGMPVETYSAERIKLEFGRVETLCAPRDHKWWGNAPAGRWTDDTQLTLALMESLCERDGPSLSAVASAHIRALGESDYGWGGTTRTAVRALKDGTPPEESGVRLAHRRGTGNGVLMKLTPLAAQVVAQKPTDVEGFLNQVAAIAAMTHRTQLAVSTAIAHTGAVAYCLATAPDNFSVDSFLDQVDRGMRLGLRYMEPDNSLGDFQEKLRTLRAVQHIDDTAALQLFGGGSSHIADSLPLSYYCFLKHYQSFEAVVAAVNAGGDTDTNGSIVGGLLGALHGSIAIPEQLWGGILEKERIERTLSRFLNYLRYQE